MKTVVITGAGRGIGLALTKEFVSKGFQVIGTYRNAGSAKELLQMAKESPLVMALTADITNENSFGPLREQIKKLKTIDILINNSGVIGDRAGSLLELDLNKVSEVFDVNTLGPMRICKLVIPFMAKDGKIAQITSQMGSIADSSGGYYDYRMSKAALNMFNMCLTKEFSNLTCLVLHPGWVQTDMGGAGASVPAKDSAAGLYKVISGSTHKQSGHFYNYKGDHLPW